MNLLEKKEYVLQNIGVVPVEELEAYNQNFAHVFTKNSSSFEGERVTLAKVIQVVTGNKLSGDDVLDRTIYNNYVTFHEVIEDAKAKKPLTEEYVKDIHEKLMNGIQSGGLYRNVDIKIHGSNHTPCSYLKVYDRMAKFYYDLNSGEKSDLELAAYTHLQIAKVHPFLDGNGRLARLMLNYQLVAAGYLPISFKAKVKERYFNALEEFKVNKTEEPFMALLDKTLNREYDRMIELIDRYKK